MERGLIGQSLAGSLWFAPEAAAETTFSKSRTRQDPPHRRSSSVRAGIAPHQAARRPNTVAFFHAAGVPRAASAVLQVESVRILKKRHSGEHKRRSRTRRCLVIQ